MQFWSISVWLIKSFFSNTNWHYCVEGSRSLVNGNITNLSLFIVDDFLMTSRLNFMYFSETFSFKNLIGYCIPAKKGYRIVNN